MALAPRYAAIQCFIALVVIGVIGLIAVLPGQRDALAQPVPAAPVAITGPADGATVATAAPWVSGTGAPDFTVEIIDTTGAPICSTTVTGRGTWRCLIATPLANGSRALVVRQAPNPGAPATSSTSIRLTVRAVGGPAPVVLAVSAAARLPAGTTTIAGTGAPGYTVRLFDTTGPAVCATTVAADGRWSCPTVLAPGRHTILASELSGPHGDQVSTAAVEVTAG